MNKLWNRHGAFSKYGDFRVSRLGRREGHLDPPIPAWEADALPPALREMVRAGDGDMQLVAQAWLDKDRKLKPAWLAADARSASATARASEAEAATLAAEAAYEARHNGKAPPSDARHFQYRLAVIFMTVLELPFNMVVFRSLGESELMTAFFAGGLAFTLIQLAHRAGLACKDGRWAKACALAALATGVLLGVAWMRSLYLAALPSADGQVRFPEGLTLCVFFLFNLALFVVAALAASAAHDEELRVVFLCRKRLKAARAALTAAQASLNRAVARREKLHAHHYALAARIISTVHRLAEVYRTANLQARPDRSRYGEAYPRCYERVGLCHMPIEIQSLQWERDLPSAHLTATVPATTALHGVLAAAPFRDCRADSEPPTGPRRDDGRRELETISQSVHDNEGHDNDGNARNGFLKGATTK